MKITLTILVSIFLLACNPSQNNDTLIFSICDKEPLSQPKKEEFSVALNFWLKENSLEGFFSEKEHIWKDSKGWREKKGLITDDQILNCISEKMDGTFLYIPNSYFKKVDVGHEYLKFYLVNNSEKTLAIPSFDNTIGNVRSEISNDLRSWSKF